MRRVHSSLEITDRSLLPADGCAMVCFRVLESPSGLQFRDCVVEGSASADPTQVSVDLIVQYSVPQNEFSDASQ